MAEPWFAQNWRPNPSPVGPKTWTIYSDGPDGRVDHFYADTDLKMLKVVALSDYRGLLQRCEGFEDALRTVREALGNRDEPFLDDAIRGLLQELEHHAADALRYKHDAQQAESRLASLQEALRKKLGEAEAMLEQVPAEYSTTLLVRAETFRELLALSETSEEKDLKILRTEAKRFESDFRKLAEDD